VAGHEELRAGDFGIVEILATGGFGEELEDVIEARVFDDEAFFGFLHFLLFLNWSGGSFGRGCCGGGGGRSLVRGFLIRGFREGAGDVIGGLLSQFLRFLGCCCDRFDENIRRVLGIKASGSHGYGDDG
jgi:hypothetical protein